MCKRIMTMIEMQEDNQIALPFGRLVMKILKKKLTNIPANEPVNMPDGPFGKQTVMKSNAQLNWFQAQDDLDRPAPSTPLVASSSHVDPPHNAVLSILAQITDRLHSIDTWMTDQFQSMDNWLISFDYRFQSLDQRFQIMEAGVAHIKINEHNTLRQILPEDQQDQVP
jgi:hypothetical protein